MSATGSAFGLSAIDLAKAIDMRRKPTVLHVDMQPMLEGSTLKRLSPDVLPRSKEVIDLGAELKRAKESGVVSPFPFVELRRMMPPWLVAQPEANRITPFAIWAAAYQCWAIAMVCPGCAKQTACAAHFDNCLRVGTEAAAASRSARLTQVYDEVVRKRLAELAHAGLNGFDVGAALHVYDTDAVCCCSMVVSVHAVHCFVLAGGSC